MTKDLNFEKVECEICHKKFNVITNTHLKLHNLTQQEYKKQFPNSKLMNDQALFDRGKSLRNKTYEEAYGSDMAKKIKDEKSLKCENQWKENEKNVLIKQISIEKKEINKKQKDIKKRERIDKKKRICKQCGKEFLLESNDRGGIFCSHECYVVNSKQTAENYRIKAFANLPNKCFYCDEKNPDNLHVHHKDRNHYNHDIENLMIVCHKHHSKIHKVERMGSKDSKFKEAAIMRAWRDIIKSLGLDVNDPNFKDTPFRILKSYYELFGGINAEDKIKDTLITAFPSDYQGMVVVNNISCFSMCPHHFLPVEYHIDFGYIPNGKVLGISKLGRFISILSRQPMLQEDFTFQVTKLFNEYVKPKGSIVQVRGRHMCMVMRGAKQERTWTLTSDITGIFNEKNVKDEFQLILKTSNGGND